MGWAKIRNKIKKAVQTVAVAPKTFVKSVKDGDVKGAIGSALAVASGGQATGALGPAAYSKYTETMNKPLPGINVDQAIRDQQAGLINNQLGNYQNFDTDKYIQGEASNYRRKLAEQVAGGQQQLRGDENARGMLFSGRRLKGESDIARAGEQDYQGYAQNLISNTLQQKQALAGDALGAQANLNLANQQQQSALQGIRNQQRAARTATQTAGMGLIGEGAGTYFGDKYKSGAK